MEDFNEEEETHKDNIQKAFVLIIKALLLVLFILFAYQLFNRINNRNLKNEEIIKQNITSFIQNNKTEKRNNALLNFTNIINSIDISHNTNNISLSIDINKSSTLDINNPNNKLINFVSYEYNYFNSFNIFKIMKQKYFKIININYTFSETFNLVKLKYMIALYDENKTLIIPSDLSLYDDLHFACFIEIENRKIINSLAYIHSNKYIKCTEIFKYKENIKYGITIYRGVTFFKIYLFLNDTIDYSNISHQNDDIFDSRVIKKNFSNLVRKIKEDRTNKTYSLKRAYLRRPKFNLRRNLVRNNSLWLFRNFYNEYFCYCLGNNCFKENEILQICKFLYYIVIIDLERNLFPKTEYIFVDFIFKSLTSDDTYPVFQEMIKQNYPVHYITEKDEIIDKYCKGNKYCQTIIPINLNTYFDYGDFFEKYLTLVLKTKAFISCKEKHFHRIGYLFYRIEYVTYIAVGHGVCYFKDYLFDNDRIYGSNRNNKIIIPPSKSLVNIAVEHGWKKEDIIQLNPPRWDRYNNPVNEDLIKDVFNGNISNNSMLVMFTWRMNQKYWNYNLSSFYMQNVTKLLQNENLIKELDNNNITLYVSFHRYIKDTYQNIIKDILKNNRNIKVLEQNDLSECLAKTNLVVSDFSSVIFDLMYRDKPFIIYIPDSDDPENINIYSDDYIQLIDRMNNGTFKIENKCNSVEETVDKMIFYIKNKFKVDGNLRKYFRYFNFKKGNNIDKFIDYLLSLDNK
jgi:CDP-glycerol glycerophosphotransferase (TagB/SpsB family)